MKTEHLKSSELLDKLLQRPALYVGQESIPLIHAYINGYEHAADWASKDDLYRNFDGWVAKRFGIASAHNWASIISFMGVSEKGGYELAKKLWQEYKSAAEGSPGEHWPV